MPKLTCAKTSKPHPYNIHLYDGSYMQVYKKTFCDLHAAGKWMIEKLAEKLDEKLSAGMFVASDE